MRWRQAPKGQMIPPPAADVAGQAFQERIGRALEQARQGAAAGAERLLRGMLAEAGVEVAADVRTGLGEALLALGRDAEARVELELALALDVGHAGAWRLLGRTRPGLEETADAFPQAGERFVLRRLLGRGGTGKVYLAHDRERCGAVALKLFDRPLLQHQGFENLLAGVRLVAALPPHPHVLPVLDVDPRLGLIVTPHQAGGSLQAQLGRPLGAAPWRELLGDIVSGLGHLHALGVLHLDLKPANLLLGSHGKIVLSDFSLCRRGAPWPRMASPDHASPEALIGEPLSAASDLYSLGIIAYELATGGRPFPANTPIRTEAYKPAHSVEPGFPEAASKLVDGLLRLEPEARLSLAELRHCLAALDGSG